MGIRVYLLFEEPFGALAHLTLCTRLYTRTLYERKKHVDAWSNVAPTL